MRQPVLASFSATTGIRSIPTNACTVRSPQPQQRCSLDCEQQHENCRDQRRQLPVAGAPASARSPDPAHRRSETGVAENELRMVVRKPGGAGRCGFSAALSAVRTIHAALGSVIIRVISSARKGSRDMSADRTAIDLYWLPLGAGGRSVRLNGRFFEAVAAVLGHRRACASTDSALLVRAGGGFVIELAPFPATTPLDAVWWPLVRSAQWSRVAPGFPLRGSLLAGRDHPRRRRGRRGPRRLSDDPERATAPRLVPHVPTPVWGRDELRTGEMWNSNSLISWLLTRCGLDIEPINPLTGGTGARLAGRHRGGATPADTSRSIAGRDTLLTQGVVR